MKTNKIFLINSKIFCNINKKNIFKLIHFNFQYKFVYNSYLLKGIILVYNFKSDQSSIIQEKFIIVNNNQIYITPSNPHILKFADFGE